MGVELEITMRERKKAKEKPIKVVQRHFCYLIFEIEETKSVDQK